MYYYKWQLKHLIPRIDVEVTEKNRKRIKSIFGKYPGRTLQRYIPGGMTVKRYKLPLSFHFRFIRSKLEKKLEEDP